MIDGIIPQHSINHVPRLCSSSILNRCLEGQNAAETYQRESEQNMFSNIGWLGCFNSFPKNITSFAFMCQMLYHHKLFVPQVQNHLLTKAPFVNRQRIRSSTKATPFHPAAPPGDLEHSPCRSYSEHRLAGSSFLSLHPPGGSCGFRFPRELHGTTVG